MNDLEQNGISHETDLRCEDVPGSAVGAGPLIWLFRGSNGQLHASCVSGSTLTDE